MSWRTLVGGHLVRLDAHQLRVVHVLVGQLQHAMRQRGREQHGLALLGLGQPAQDEADVGDETEVEHAVGFVEHHGLGVAHVEHVLLEVVDDAAGRADQHVDAVLQRLALFFVVDAAKYHGNPETGVLTQHLRVIEDLHGELARGRQDQRADADCRCGHVPMDSSAGAGTGPPETRRSCRCPFEPGQQRPCPGAQSAKYSPARVWRGRNQLH